ncbi:D-glycero-beta-D-manno-heptose 1,7-bisphosphate 7-phosphatase [Burkholderiaceae bacterium UC74_6]
MSDSVGRSPAAFIDRDGVINVEHGYVHRAEDFELIDGVPEGLALLAAAGYRLVVVTNQSGIARGRYTVADMDRLHAHMRAVLAGHGVELAGIYHCPHLPSSAGGSVAEYAIECDCRKPAPGMLLQAARELDLDLDRSVIVGDKSSDLLAGQAAGLPYKVLVRSGHEFDATAEAVADAVADDLRAAAQLIRQRG